jgi:hypothetical protein
MTWTTWLLVLVAVLLAYTSYWRLYPVDVEAMERAMGVERATMARPWRYLGNCPTDQEYCTRNPTSFAYTACEEVRPPMSWAPLVVIQRASSSN